MSYRPYFVLIKSFIPTIVMIGTTSVIWKICDHYEKKYKYERPLLKISTGIPLYFLFLCLHFYEFNRSTMSLKILKHMKLSRKC